MSYHARLLRLLAGPRRAAVPALARDATGRRCPAFAAPTRARDRAAGLGAAAAVVDRGGARLGRRRQAALPPRRGTARAPADRAAVDDPGRTGRASANAPDGRAISRARADPGRGAAAVRRGHRFGHAPSELGGRRGAADRVCLHRRGRVRLAHAGRPGRGELVRRAGGWEIAAVGRRLVAGPRQPADVPVPAPALVLPAVHLGALPVAGVAASICGSCRRIRIAQAAWASSARWPMHSHRCFLPRGPCWAG